MTRPLDSIEYVLFFEIQIRWVFHRLYKNTRTISVHRHQRNMECKKYEILLKIETMSR